jgi:hypothetical protein
MKTQIRTMTDLPKQWWWRRRRLETKANAKAAVDEQDAQNGFQNNVGTLSRNPPLVKGRIGSRANCDKA